MHALVSNKVKSAVEGQSGSVVNFSLKDDLLTTSCVHALYDLFDQ